MINYFKKKKESRGFTLIELITVIGVIIILTGIVLLMPREGIDMDLTARKMVSDFRWIQNAAMVGYSPPGASKVYGFGIHTESDGYTLYYSKKEEHTAYDKDEVDEDGKLIYKKIRDVKFPGGLIIKNAVGQDADVFYIPPDPTVIISSTPGTESIDFDLYYKEREVTIEVFKSGLIEY